MAVQARLVLHPGAVAAYLASPEGAVARDLAIRAQRIKDQAVVNASGRPGPNVITGRLRSSIQWRFVGDGTSLWAEVGTDVYYARYVEFGTTNAYGGQRNPPYPFLRPALSAGFGSHHG